MPLLASLKKSPRLSRTPKEKKKRADRKTTPSPATTDHRSERNHSGRRASGGSGQSASSSRAVSRSRQPRRRGAFESDSSDSDSSSLSSSSSFSPPTSPASSGGRVSGSRGSSRSRSSSLSSTREDLTLPAVKSPSLPRIGENVLAEGMGGDTGRVMPNHRQHTSAPEAMPPPALERTQRGSSLLSTASTSGRSLLGTGAGGRMGSDRSIGTRGGAPSPRTLSRNISMQPVALSAGGRSIPAIQYALEVAKVMRANATLFVNSTTKIIAELPDSAAQRRRGPQDRRDALSHSDGNSAGIKYRVQDPAVLASFCSGRLLLAQRTLGQLLEVCTDINDHIDTLSAGGMSSAVRSYVRPLLDIISDARDAWEKVDRLRSSHPLMLPYFIPLARPRVLDVASLLDRSILEKDLADMQEGEASEWKEKMELVSPLVPQLILDRVARAVQQEGTSTDARMVLEGESGLEEFPFGIVLVVDISGFSSLAEEFEKASISGKDGDSMHASRNKAGGERVASVINTMFSLFMDTISKYGGDVLKIAGDAAISVFNMSTDAQQSAKHKQQAVLNTLRCVLEINQRVLAAQVAEGSAVKMLDVHSSVAAGLVQGASVGGVSDCLEFFPSGTAFEDLRVDLAGRQEIVVSANVFRAAGGHAILDAAELSSSKGFYRLDGLRPDAPDSAIPSRVGALHATRRTARSVYRYIPQALRPQVESGIFSVDTFASEMRVVSTVFLTLQGFTMDLNDASSKGEIFNEVDQLVSAMQRRVARLQGYLRQFLVDDKGYTVIIGVWGAPVTHSNDAARATNFAMDAISHINYQLKSFGVKVYGGVATGRAFCGMVGSAERHEYALVGPAVNLSARLMAFAAGQGKTALLVDDATRQAAQDHGLTFAKGVSKPVMFKGKKEPIMVYVPGKAVPVSVGGEDNYISISSLSRDSNSGRDLASMSKSGVSGIAQVELFARDYELDQLSDIAGNFRLASCAEHLPDDPIANKFLQDMLGGGKDDDLYMSTYYTLYEDDPYLSANSRIDTSASGVLISGPAGIGKKTLVRALLRQLRTAFGTCPSIKKKCRGCLVYWGGGDDSKQGDSFHAWIPMIRQLLDLEGDISPADARSKVVQAFEVMKRHDRTDPKLISDADFGLSHVDVLLHALDPMGDDCRAAEDTEDLTSIIVGLIRYYVIVAPRVLVLDGAHTVDDDSWIALMRVMREVDLPQLLIVLTMRPETTLSELAQEGLRVFRARKNTHDFSRLAPLDEEDVEELLMSTWDCDVIEPESLIKFVRAQTGGNPLLTKLLASNLQSTKLVGLCKGSRDHAKHSKVKVKKLGRHQIRYCVLAKGGMDQVQKVALPENAEQMIRSVLDELTSEQQQIVKIAAVLGRAFTIRILRRALKVVRRQEKGAEKTKVTPGSVGDQLIALNSHNIVQESVGDEDNAILGGLRHHIPPSDAKNISKSSEVWFFTSYMIREVAYKTVPLERRKQLHDFIGDIYQHMTARPSSLPEDLLLYFAAQSYHFRLAGKPEKAEAARAELRRLSESEAQKHDEYMDLRGYG